MNLVLTMSRIKILLGASLAVLALSVVALLYSGWGVDQFGTPAAWFAALGTFSAVTLALRQSWKQEKQFAEELERQERQSTEELERQERQSTEELERQERQFAEELERQANLREADKLARDHEVWSERIIELIELHERLLRTPSDFATWSRIRSLLVSIPAKYGRLLGEAVAIPRDPWIEWDDENPRSKIAGEDYSVVDARLPQIELHANLRSLQGVPNVDILSMVTDYANAMRVSSEWKSGAEAVFKDVHARHFPTPRES